MERLWALGTCILLLGVLVNVECSGNSTEHLGVVGNATIPKVNATRNVSNTTDVPVTTTVPLLNGNKTEQNNTAPNSTIPVTSATPPEFPGKSTSVMPESRTTKGPQTSPAPTRTETTTVDSPKEKTSNKAGYIVLVLIILIAIILTTYCCLKQNKTRRYSVDLHNAHEDAVIPLSTVEADGVFDATPEKEMETFTAPETSSAPPEAAPPDAKPAVDPEPAKGEPVAGTEKTTEAEEASGSQEPLASEQMPEKMEVVDLNEAAISTKTSMESLEDQLNDNNSNNYCTRASGIVCKGGLYEILQSDPF